VRAISLAWRLRLLAGLVALLVAGAVSLTTYRTFRAAYLDQVDRMLALVAAGLLRAAEGAGGVTEEATALAASPWRGPASELRVWLDGADRDLVSTLAPGRVARAAAALSQNPPPAGEPRFLDVADKGRRFRAVWLRREIPAGVANALVLQPVNYEQRRLLGLVAVLAASAAAAVLLAAALAGPLVRLTLDPLRRLGARLSLLAPERAAAAAAVAGEWPAELRPLVREVDELVARFAAGIERQRSLVGEAAHQLRTPLAMARSSLELALSREAGASGLGTAGAEVLADLARIERLVEQLVTLALVEGAPLAFDPEGLRLDVLLEEVAASYEKRAAERGVRIHTERLPAVGIDGDRAALRLLFGGLVENALQYGPAGRPVRLGLELGPEGHCTVTVQDDGGRIPAHGLDRLFERFYRAEETRELHSAGAGLGLAIAREAARRHGGEVWATSTPGTRTTFHVRLPVRARNQP